MASPLTNEARGTGRMNRPDVPLCLFLYQIHHSCTVRWGTLQKLGRWTVLEKSQIILYTMFQQDQVIKIRQPKRPIYAAATYCRRAEG